MDKIIEQTKVEDGQKYEPLSPVLNKEGIFTKKRSNGRILSIRKDRHRIFLPEEWFRFLEDIKKEEQRFLFETLMNTGARITECLNIRVSDFFFDRGYIRLFVTKTKAKKHEIKAFGGTSRSFVVSSTYLKKAKQYIASKQLKDNDKLFSYHRIYIHELLKLHLQRAGIKDWYNFSLHNIRKTHGMYLKTMMEYTREITESEICNRLGHDFNTYIKHYSIPNPFIQKDKTMIRKILGDIYGL